MFEQSEGGREGERDSLSIDKVMRGIHELDTFRRKRKTKLIQKKRQNQ